MLETPFQIQIFDADDSHIENNRYILEAIRDFLGNPKAKTKELIFSSSEAALEFGEKVFRTVLFSDKPVWVNDQYCWVGELQTEKTQNELRVWRERQFRKLESSYVETAPHPDGGRDRMFLQYTYGPWGPCRKFDFRVVATPVIVVG